ncbi:hypothetical protein PTKIN_Ptkin05aG0052300 [Pterospermum kingtungense]
MRFWNPKFSFMFFMIILAATIHLSSCRYLHRSLKSEVEETTTTNTKFSTRHFPAKSPEASKAEKSQPVYEVSYRTVPGGPNPLHN